MDKDKRGAILNSLVTFAAENIPGGLNEEEREVAQIVGKIANGAKEDISKRTAFQTHNYKVTNSTSWGKGNMIEAIEHWASLGWRVVGIVSDTRPGYASSLVLERPVGITHPDD